MQLGFAGPKAGLLTRWTSSARMRGADGFAAALCLMLAFSSSCCAGQEETEMSTRKPAVAGQFYPAGTDELASAVDSMLAAGEGTEPGGRVVGIQVPHAGYPYSGPTAARALGLLKGMDSLTVVMVGPSHRVLIDKAAVYAKGRWSTPLGEVEIDEELATLMLAESDFLVDMPAAHAAEHSLEVQMPFLQRALGDFKIVPVMVLQPSWDECEQLGRAIAAASRGRNVLLLASTDLYHGESYDDAKAADSLTGELFAGFDPRALYDGLAAGRAQACGGYPVVSVMVAARELGADKAVLLGMTNSNDVMGERGGYCVGYSATAFVASGGEDTGESAARRDERGAVGLSEEEKESLLDIARTTLEQHIAERKRPGFQPLTPTLEEKRGAFVTLHKHGELRGCIGYVEAVKPLYEAVSDMAVAASTEDPRFPPVVTDELESIDIEITVLSPLREIDDPESVVVGKHGLVIRRGMRSGLLLPQVPVEQGWNREQFLDHTCLKAGLPPGTWKDNETTLLVFTGEVFGEREE